MLNKKVLVFAAHPDDEAIGCAGTLARFAAEGAEVHFVYVADGVGARQNDEHALVSSSEHIARQEAAKAAANILGAKSVNFGDFPDNRMDAVDLLDIVQFVDKMIDKHKPGTVLTHHAGDLNIDHRRVHQAVVTACRPQPMHPVRTLLFFEVCSSTEWQTPASNASVFSPNWFVDISSYFELRVHALEAYAFEMRAWPHSRSLEAMEHLVRWRGAMVGVEAAEAFMLGRNIMV